MKIKISIIVGFLVGLALAVLAQTAVSVTQKVIPMLQQGLVPTVDGNYSLLTTAGLPSCLAIGSLQTYNPTTQMYGPPIIFSGNTTSGNVTLTIVGVGSFTLIAHGN